MLRKYGFLVALAVLVVVVQTQNERFLTQTNLFNITEQWSYIAVMAVGMTFVLIGFGFDLSIGSTFAFAAVLSGSIAANGGSGVLALVVAVLFGGGVGWLNGLCVTKLNINPFITTLASAQIIRGFAFIFTGGENYSPDNGFLKALGSGEVGPVPIPFLVMLGVVIAGALTLAYTSYGRRVYAIGGNDEASFLSGIATDRIRTSTYVIAGLTAALAGVMFVGRIGSAQANIGIGIEFDVIAACLIGGISISGGEGAVWRAAAGVALLAVLQNFFNAAHIGDFWELVTKGFIILGAVSLDAHARRGHGRSFRQTLASMLRSRRPVTTAGGAVDVEARQK